MALKFKLHGLAETFVESLVCPNCHAKGADEEHFSTELTRVTFDGIIVVAQCRLCQEIFVPRDQHLGVIDNAELKKAVEQDSADTGEPVYPDIETVKLNVEKLNALRRGELH